MWLFSRDPLKDFPYDIGEKSVNLDDKSIWSLHEGKKKLNGESVSIFVYDVKSGNDEKLLLVKATMKRIKTLRHPNILTYIDGIESEKSCMVVTEPVKPLLDFLDKKYCDKNEEAMRELNISWGLHQIAKGLIFLNEDCSIVHANINPASIFVDSAGEWKIGGLEFSFNFTSDRSLKNFPALSKYNPPELQQSTKSPSIKWSEDAWGFGCLIWEIFNGPFSQNSMLKNPGKIPQNLTSLYKSLININPKSRISPSKFVKDCRTSNGFMDNKFVTTMLFLENIQIQDQESKNQFFNGLADILDSIPNSFCRLKILPQLIHAFEFGNSGSAVLTPLFKLGRLLDSDEYQKRMVPCVVKLFSSTDRATRVKLLQQMEFFIEYLSQSIVNKEIFPSVVTGFLDSNPVVREQTIKSMLHLAPKLDYKNLNEEVLKHFSRLQAKDEQGGIRTNTTVCLGKIACFLNPQVRQRVLTSAFLRALKDPFPPSRQAGILALAATHNFFSLQEASQRLLPSLVTMTMDPDKTVRDHVFKTIKCFLGKLENLSEHPEQKEELEKDVLSGASGVSSSGAGWAGWAVSGMSTLTSKIYSTKPNSKHQVPAKETNDASISNEKISTSSKENTHRKSSLNSVNTMDKVQISNISSVDVMDDADWGDGWGDINEPVEPSCSTNIVHPSPSNGWEINEDAKSDDDENWGDIEASTEVRKDEFIPDTTGHAKASSYNWDSAYDTGSSKRNPSSDDYFFDSILTETKPISASSNKLNLAKTKPTDNTRKKTSIEPTNKISQKSFDCLPPENPILKTESGDSWDNDGWGALDAWAQEDLSKTTSKFQSKQSVKNK